MTTCEDCKKKTGGICEGCYLELSGLTREEHLENQISGLKKQIADRERRDKHPTFRCSYKNGVCEYCGLDDQWTIDKVTTKSGSLLFFIQNGKSEYMITLQALEALKKHE